MQELHDATQVVWIAWRFAYEVHVICKPSQPHMHKALQRSKPFPMRGSQSATSGDEHYCACAVLVSIAFCIRSLRSSRGNQDWECEIGIWSLTVDSQFGAIISYQLALLVQASLGFCESHDADLTSVGSGGSSGLAHCYATAIDTCCT